MQVDFQFKLLRVPHSNNGPQKAWLAVSLSCPPVRFDIPCSTVARSPSPKYGAGSVCTESLELSFEEAGIRRRWVPNSKVPYPADACPHTYILEEYPQLGCLTTLLYRVPDHQQVLTLPHFLKEAS
jgi:hypothetical protein